MSCVNRYTDVLITRNNDQMKITQVLWVFFFIMRFENILEKKKIVKQNE